MRRKQSRVAGPSSPPIREYILPSSLFEVKIGCLEGVKSKARDGFKNEGQARLLAQIASIRYDAIVHALWDLLIGAHAGL